MTWQNSIVARKLFVLSFIGACFLLFSSCTVQFVALYDQQTDTSVTTLQRRVETFLVELESLGSPECDYVNHTSFYQEAKVDVKAIHIRAAAIPQNELTTQQVVLVEQNLGLLEDLHKDHCLSPEEIEQLIRPGFDSAFTAILKLELAKQRGKS